MYRARENPLSGFLSTTQGKVTAALVAAGAVVGAIFLSKSSSAASSTTGTPTGLPAGQPANLLFTLTTPYPNAPGNLTVVQADLLAAGFAPALVQRDPTTTNTWVVAATYPPTGNLVPAITLALTTGVPTTTAAGAPVGPGQFQIPLGGTAIMQASGLAIITGGLPTPMSVSLTTGVWYAFSVRTSFLQSAAGAQADVISLLQGMGFGGGGTAAAPALLVAPVTQSAPGPGSAITDPTALDTWNVIAKFTGAAGTAVGMPFTVTDGPPLLFFLPKAVPTALGASIAPGTVPSNVMP